MNMNVRERMEKVVEEGRQDVATALESIQREFVIRRDLVVKNDKIAIAFNGAGAMTIKTPDRDFLATEHSEGQAFSHYGVPRAFADKLISWKMTPLLERNFAEIGSTRFGSNGVMLRTVGDQVKGWLSPSFRRIDASPVLGSFVEGAVKAGMVPIRGFNTDYRYQLRFAFPDVIVPRGIDSEATLFGASLTTGDYGGSAFKAELFLMRLICLNGMIGTQVFRHIHVGSRFTSSDDVAILSNETQRLDVRTMSSAVRDMIRALPAQRETIGKRIDDAFEKEPSRAAWDAVRKATDKGTFEEIEKAYNSKADVSLLPEEKSSWRLANAISLIAQGQEKADKRIDLEALAMSAVA